MPTDERFDDTDYVFEDLHPETQRLLSRRGFIGKGAGAAALSFMGMAVVGCSTTSTTSTGTSGSTAGTTATTAGRAGTTTKGAAPGGTSLYDRLGGADAVTAVVAGFLAKVAADNRINSFFAKTNVPALQSQVVDLLGQATGGPQKYVGPDMKKAHAGMNITVNDFNAFVEDLVATLDGAKVPATEKQELLNLLAPMQSDIVTA